MTKFAQVGDFCPDESCPDYGKHQDAQQHNIIKYGKTKAGRQRYKCKTCNAQGTMDRIRAFPGRVSRLYALAVPAQQKCYYRERRHYHSLCRPRSNRQPSLG